MPLGSQEETNPSSPSNDTNINGKSKDSPINNINKESVLKSPISLKTKRKKPFIMVKTGMLPIKNGSKGDINNIEIESNDKGKTNEDEESYVKTLLNDQSLVEEDILQNRPMIAKSNSDLMSNSASSVVITPTIQTTNNGMLKLMPHNDSNDGATSSSINKTNSNDMNYSDSDFESNLIGRLDNNNNNNDNINSDDDDDDSSTDSSAYKSDEIIRLDGSSEMDSDISSPSPSSSTSSTTSSSSSSDDEYEDVMPVNPATLDRNLHYAIQKFQGPESSHCPLQKNEECIVLNDEDVYWWLVRRVKDGRIGFVPGELLEGWTEKLAKWNTFMNERQLDGNDQEEEGEVEYEDEDEDEENENNNVESNDHKKKSNDDIDSDASSTYSNENKETLSNGKTLVKNKSNSSANVKFDENVTYVPYDSMESVYSGSLHEELNLDEDFKSDISWGSMPKLQVKKNSSTPAANKQIGLHQNISSTDDIDVWKPEKPFATNNDPVSSPSIGEYSTSQESLQTSEINFDDDDDEELHSAVSREYNPIFEKMDEIINRLR